MLLMMLYIYVIGWKVSKVLAIKFGKQLVSWSASYDVQDSRLGRNFKLVFTPESHQVIVAIIECLIGGSKGMRDRTLWSYIKNHECTSAPKVPWKSNMDALFPTFFSGIYGMHSLEMSFNRVASLKIFQKICDTQRS